MTTPEPGAIVVTGTERLAWDQPGDTSGLLFRAHIDGTPVELNSATCAASPDTAVCSTPLPPLTDGVHVISVTAITESGTESVSSNPITVQKVSAARAIALRASLTDATAHSGVQSEVIVPGPDGQTFVVDTVADSLKPPLQLAAIPDGRLLVADGNGQVSVSVPGAPGRGALALDTNKVLGRGADSGAVGLAVHPDFARNRFVYLSLVSSDRSGAQLRIVRLREVGGLLGEPATVFEAPLATPGGTAAVSGDSLAPSLPDARLAFGPDGLLYALLSPGAVFEREPAASAPLGSIARIDSNGRLPETGALNGVAATPLGLAWHPVTNELLTIFGASDGTARIASIAGAVLTGASSTTALSAERRVDGSWSGGRLRFDSEVGPAVPLSRAFIERLGQPQPVAVRLMVPVALDGLLGSLSGELTDVVAAAGTVYAAVTQSSGAVAANDREAHILRLRQR